jgi:hypothetical protein
MTEEGLAIQQTISQSRLMEAQIRESEVWKNFSFPKSLGLFVTLKHSCKTLPQ